MAESSETSIEEKNFSHFKDAILQQEAKPIHTQYILCDKPHTSYSITLNIHSISIICSWISAWYPSKSERHIIFKWYLYTFRVAENPAYSWTFCLNWTKIKKGQKSRG